ncbi:C6 zinc finger domain-containing protein [Apiospora marii]|uniref:C6 zinc finger domain-containing protein n=1 Tax=Apiospora marii TaxID=335849 RepID=A0ABR1S8W1_9PEZI
MAEVDTAPQSAPQSRRKFAVPPVKVACLACPQCVAKERQCVYKPSRRGGPRFRKKTQPPEGSQEPDSLHPGKMEGGDIPPVSIENYIDPGAGLKNLGDAFNDSDALFDSLFMNSHSDNSQANNSPNEGEMNDPMVRVYESDAQVLNAYYIWIHPFFPILPAPHYSPGPDEPTPFFQNRPNDIDESSSPLGLAISALLALIPCPQDRNSLAEDSVVFRRKYAQFVAQAAIESIELDSERPESSVEPRKALEDPDDVPRRPAFCPDVPIELEGIIALDILSVYEYAQRGNLKKTKNRASTAMMFAMDLSLHLQGDVEDAYSECKRRVWWMTYICYCQSCIVGNTLCGIHAELYGPPSDYQIRPSGSFLLSSATASLANKSSKAWYWFMKSQQAILAATEFVIDLNKAVATEADMTPSYQRMMELETFLEPLITESEQWVLNCPMTQPVDNDEAVVAHSLRCMARIKLNSARIKVHRYCAFFDAPIFSGKHCDLKAISDKDKSAIELIFWPMCCDNASPSSPASSHHTAASSSPARSNSSNNHSQIGRAYQSPLALIFPFSSHQSAKICLKSSLNIAQSFDSLPYPNPSSQLCDPPCYLGLRSNVIAPRTMPSFACCAMQCAYVLLSVYDKTQATYPQGTTSNDVLVNDLLGRLQQGMLSILATLENYGTAFEALGGMRGKQAIGSSI